MITLLLPQENKETTKLWPILTHDSKGQVAAPKFHSGDRLNLYARLCQRKPSWEMRLSFLLGDYDWGGNDTPLQYSCLEKPMDGGDWWAAVHGVTKSQTQLSDFTFTFHFHALEKEMATHSSVLAWRIPGTREPGGLLSLGSHRVGHDWCDLAVACY